MMDLPLTITPMSHEDLPQIERLDERVFGPGRFARSAYRLREGVEPAFDSSFVACIGTLIVGANRMTPILCGNATALLLGPLTVEVAFRSRGIGAMLIHAALNAAKAHAQSRVILVGDFAYYSRFGFERVPPGRLLMPGPVDPARLLWCALQPDAFAEVSGAIRQA